MNVIKKKEIAPTSFKEYMLVVRTHRIVQGLTMDFENIIEKSTDYEYMKKRRLELFMSEKSYTTEYLIYGREKRKWFELRKVD
jgi:hypothetical protein